LNYLEKHMSARAETANTYATAPELDEPRSDPRFREMLKRMICQNESKSSEQGTGKQHNSFAPLRTNGSARCCSMPAGSTNLLLDTVPL